MNKFIAIINRIAALKPQQILFLILGIVIAVFVLKVVFFIAFWLMAIGVGIFIAVMLYLFFMS